MAITNPFNLRPDGSDWLGMSGTSNNFVEFENPSFGLRAGFKNMYNQKKLHNIDTIDDYINKYAPTSDNSTASVENYKQMLEKVLGVSRGDKIDLNDPDTMLKIGKAQIQMEQGNMPYSDALLRAALAQATNTPEKETKAMADNTQNGMLGYGAMQRLAEQMMLEGKVPPNSTYLPTMPATLDPSAYQADIYPPQAALAQQQVEPNPYSMAEAVAGTVPILQTDTNSGVDATTDFPGFIGTANAQTLSPNDQMMSGNSQLPARPTMATAQTRKQTPLSIPDPRVGRDEMLMRVGGAMMGASPRGGLAAYEAAINQYGNIQDYNRDVGLQAYKTAMENQPKAGTDDETLQQIGQIDQTMFDMNRAKEYLNKGGITGLIQGTLGAGVDKIFGNAEKVSGRLLLEKLRVDDTLLRIAQTKGAISNKEMDLFLAPTPKITDTEQVWLQWIDDRQQAITRVRQRLAGGQTVAQGEQASSAQVNQYGSGVGSSFTAPDMGQSTDVDGITVKRVN